ncbi:ABC transporter permease [Trueperella pecoris]|uniref:ABC transporter permease subunit n=1 Tax=Trueperella pecoris TaxID=2733571 RepID=A0A7M1QV84_9ACTO|nr:ABC transporter permease subunit [Trueperella pecoris]QOR45255.1 ABC transporter permease subunit [Trueperella pecoris]
MTWVVINLGWIVELTLRYLVLVSVAIVVALLVSVPVGWLGNRWRLGREGLIALVGALYAIPSLPMFTVIPIITGAPIRSMTTVVIVLSLYGVALLVRTVADAFAALSRDVIRASESLGYSGWRRFWGVELPLAGPGRRRRDRRGNESGARVNLFLQAFARLTDPANWAGASGIWARWSSSSRWRSWQT